MIPNSDLEAVIAQIECDVPRYVVDRAHGVAYMRVSTSPGDDEYVRWDDLKVVLAALVARPQPQAAAEGENATHVIRRVVTGDGAQLENLDITDDEWRCICEDVGNDPEHFEITLRLEDWLAMVHIARATPPTPPAVSPSQDEARAKAEREVFNIVHRGGLEHVNVRGEHFTDDDLIRAGQDWGEAPAVSRAQEEHGNHNDSHLVLRGVREQGDAATDLEVVRKELSVQRASGAENDAPLVEAPAVSPPPQVRVIEALRAAAQFLDPEVSRGPAVNGWQTTKEMVDAALETCRALPADDAAQSMSSVRVLERGETAGTKSAGASTEDAPWDVPNQAPGKVEAPAVSRAAPLDLTEYRHWCDGRSAGGLSIAADIDKARALLAEIERLRAERDKLRGALRVTGGVIPLDLGAILLQRDTAEAEIERLRAERDELKAAYGEMSDMQLRQRQLAVDANTELAALKAGLAGVIEEMKGCAQQWHDERSDGKPIQIVADDQGHAFDAFIATLQRLHGATK